MDFCSLKAKLVVEVDGEIHQANPSRDKLRDGLLSQLGYRVLRFTNEMVVNDMENVLAAIRRAL